jgi:hypothetical protein
MESERHGVTTIILRPPKRKPASDCESYDVTKNLFPVSRIPEDPPVLDELLDIFCAKYADRLDMLAALLYNRQVQPKSTHFISVKIYQEGHMIKQNVRLFDDPSSPPQDPKLVAIAFECFGKSVIEYRYMEQFDVNVLQTHLIVDRMIEIQRCRI